MLTFGTTQLAALNPRIVYASVSGYGPTGPLAESAGYDFVAQARTGLMSVTGPPGGEGFKTGVAVIDLFAGATLGMSTLAALHRARETGRGARVDTSLYESGAALLSYMATSYFATGRAPQARGNAHPQIVPYDALRTRDGSVVIACGNDAQFRNLCRALGLEAWGAAPEFATNADRVQHREAVVAGLEARLCEEDTATWIDTLAAEDVLCTPINDLEAFYNEPQARHLGIRTDIGAGVDVVRHPTRYVDAEGRDANAVEPRRPPGLGEHTDEVLAEVLGCTAGEIKVLRGDGVVA
jgi:crotonobetainyl-CoA:carnitine CoA-transferase CaiB-like acyl-CoA transferase